MLGDQAGDDVGHHLVGRGVRTVAEPLDCLAAVVIPHHPAEADHGAGGVRLDGGDGLVHGDRLRAQHRVDHFKN